jgi:hypothetical protein
MEFSGRLQAFPPGDLLQWARNDRRTGALVLRRSSREKRVLFREGAVAGCISDDPGEFYGQHLLLNGRLQEGELIRALTYCARQGMRLGKALLELKILLPEAIRETLRDHIQDLVCDLFLWHRGVFYFEAAPAQEEEISPLPIDTFGLVLEGTRWIDEYRRIRQVLVNDEMVLSRGGGPASRELTPLERWVVGKVNGRRTLGQVYRSIGGSYFRFLDATLSLCLREVLDIAEVPPAVATGTRELSLHDLMLEQAREEHAHVSPQGLGVPLEMLKGLVPVWFGEPLPEGGGESFYARCDGTARLGDLLPADSEAELDLLFVALRRGVLALLPAPLAELEAAAERRKTPSEKRWWQRLFQAAGVVPPS